MLRILFAVLAVGILLAGGLVASLVGFTFLRLTDEHPPMWNVRPHPVLRIGGPFSGVDVAPVDVWDRHGPINILLMGLDEEDCLEPEGTYRRTDTIILVRVDPQARRVAMMSVPRDLYVSVQGHGARKINTAHLLGERDRDLPGGGPALVKLVVAENLGIPVHRFARVDYKGFKRIIDALGGIDLDIPPSPANPEIGLFDAEYPDGHCGTMTVEFEPGPQHLTAEEALQYARSRSTTSDFDRSRRQMEVLMAVRKRATNLRMFLRLKDFVPALLDTVDSDFSPGELFALAGLARDIQPGDITTYQIDADVVYDQMFIIDDVPQAVLMLRPDAFDVLLQDFLSIGVEELTTDRGPGGDVN